MIIKMSFAFMALFVTLTASAQLKVNYLDGGVVVGDNSITSSKARLTVNNCSQYGSVEQRGTEAFQEVEITDGV